MLKSIVKTNKDCIIFLSHHLRPGSLASLNKLAKECSDCYDVIPILDQSHKQFSTDKIKPNALLVTSDSLEKNLAYPQKCFQHPGTLWPDNIDLPLLWFYLNNSQYRNYWLIEYDVRFSGVWSDFFAIFDENSSDLLAISIFDYEFRPEWRHWGSFSSRENVTLENLVRATLSFYRMSNRALSALDKAYREGASGHYEVVIPTILKKAGYSLEDFGGDGAYVAPGNHNRFYINAPKTPGLGPGTFVLHAKDMIKEKIPNMLWNPFKD